MHYYSTTQPANALPQNKKSRSRFPHYNADKPYTALNMAEPQVINANGYMEIGVYTALGALPVENATVTIFRNAPDGREIVLTYFKTGIDGQTTVLEVPVEYNPNDPNMDPENYYSTYNVRVSADNYYTVNVVDVQVYPKTKSLLNISLIPVANGEPLDSPGFEVIIPPQGVPVNVNADGGEYNG